ncbi:MAG: TraB/GumN family protein [Crocinitomicaceae bacterium]|nr:TraB/GumN family protein [Crocinitomicaceae bacterium]
MRIFFLSFLFLSITTFSQSESNAYGLLWEAKNKQTNQKVYLFGSIHSNDKSFFNFSDSLYYYFKNSELLVLEADLLSIEGYPSIQGNKKSLKIDPNGEVYSTSKTPSNSIYGNEDGMPQFLDAYFQEYAENSGMKIKFLESIDFQLDLVKKLTVNKVKSSDNIITLNKLKKTYLNRDIHGIAREVKKSMEENNYHELFTKRNISMVDSILKFSKDQNPFCVIGSGHFGGANGILRILERKGFKVRSIKHTMSNVASKEKTAIKNIKHYTLTDTVVKLNANFPGKPNLKIEENESKTYSYTEFGQGNHYSIEIIPHNKKEKIEDLANIHISNSKGIPAIKKTLGTGEVIVDGISDTYIEGLHHIRIMQNDKYYLLIKATGGNKFMSSERFKKFFGSIWFYE